MANITLSRVSSSNAAIVREHFTRFGALSTRDAMAFYGMTGGTFTKVISEMAKGSNATITRQWSRCAVTGRRYANYIYTVATV